MSFAFAKLHNIFNAGSMEGLKFLFILDWNGDIVFMMAARPQDDGVFRESGKYTEYLCTVFFILLAFELTRANLIYSSLTAMFL